MRASDTSVCVSVPENQFTRRELGQVNTYISLKRDNLVYTYYTCFSIYRSRKERWSIWPLISSPKNIVDNISNGLDG